LITPPIDCTDWVKLILTFDKNYHAYFDDTDAFGLLVHLQNADVDIAVKDIDTGLWGEWVNLRHWDATDGQPGSRVPGSVEFNTAPEEIDLSVYDGEIIKLRFHYYDANYDYWFAIDSIKLTGEKKPEEEPAVTEVNLVGGNVALTWGEFGGGSYTVQYTDDLTSPVWNTAFGPTTNTTWSGEDTSGIGYRYYRIKSE
jgi:hypothetical protein